MPLLLLLLLLLLLFFELAFATRRINWERECGCGGSLGLGVLSGRFVHSLNGGM